MIDAVAFLSGLGFLDASILGALSIFLMTILKCMNFLFSYQPRFVYVKQRLCILVTFFKAIFFNIEKIAMEFTFNFCPTNPEPMCPLNLSVGNNNCKRQHTSYMIEHARNGSKS